MLIAEVPGARLADLRGSPEFARWLPAVAEAVATLHATRVEGLPPVAKRNKEGSALSAARTLAAICPKIGDHALRLGAKLAARLAESSVRSVPVHGDFYDDQIVVSSAGVVLLDLDAAGVGNPLLDVGNFLAQLTARHDESSRGVFVESYARVRPDTREEWPLFEAAALLRLAVKPFRHLEPDWPHEVEHLIELSTRRLEDDRRSRQLSVSPADPRLPQLELLQDPARVARELERLLETGPVEVTQAALVRHETGRRCVLRYDVRIQSNGATPTERLYGKAFANARGAQVYKQLRTLSSGAACGPHVAIPEPVGYILPWKLLLERAVPGEPILPALVAGDERLAVRIAEALHALHQSEVCLERRHELVKEFAPLGDRVERLAASSPRLASHARRCLELARALSDRPWQWRSRPVHRDFYHDHVLVGEHGLSVLEWDDAAMSEPAVDVANFLAHLRLLSLQRTGTPDALDGVSAVFAERYRKLDSALDAALLRLLEGATLLRLAETHLPEERGEWLAERLLEQSELLITP
jgi:aminoglycoside phosphotransferase (APT) family kinase protein